jgi:hypothetical protein
MHHALNCIFRERSRHKEKLWFRLRRTYVKYNNRSLEVSIVTEKGFSDYTLYQIPFSMAIYYISITDLL